MGAIFQVTLAFVAWFVVAIAPTGRLGFEDRGLPRGKRRGVAIFPGWPVMPLLFLIPMPFLGAQHLVLTIIAVFHAVLLVWALGDLAYWAIRTRRDG